MSPNARFRSILGATVVAVVAAVLAHAASAQAADRSRTPQPAVADAGRAVFARHCQTCHGPRGNGRGELARGMLPKPRDFTLGLFKFRSTPSGALPTDDDLARTIRGGLAGSAMPAFHALTDREIRAVIEHLKTLSPRWRKAASGEPPTPLHVPPVPDWMHAPATRRPHADRGRNTFQSTCAPCHGPEGRGDGPSARDLRDARGDACSPRNLRGDPFRRGATPSQLFLTLATGLDGSPMPSFASALTDQERWDLVALLLEWQPPAPTESGSLTKP